MTIRYFAKNSTIWGGGAAFLCTQLRDKNNKSSHGRMYLITNEQFLDVVEQENGDRLDIDFELVKSKTIIKVDSFTFLTTSIMKDGTELLFT